MRRERRVRRRKMTVMRRVGVALMLAAVMLLVLSEDPYLYGVITTGGLLVRFGWAIILWFAGMNLYRWERR